MKLDARSSRSSLVFLFVLDIFFACTTTAASRHVDDFSTGCLRGQLKDADECSQQAEQLGGSYKVSSVQKTQLGWTVELELAHAAPAALGPDFAKLQLDVEFQTPQRLRVLLAPSDNPERWRVPHTLLPRPEPPRQAPDPVDYRVHIPQPGELFGFALSRADTGETVFNTTGFSLIFKEQYMELSTAVPPSASLYGLGETTASAGLRLQRDGRTITLWNADNGAMTPDINLYGSHPFYLDVREDGRTHGVLLVNSNGMDVLLKEHSLTYRVIGGVFEFYFLLGDTPDLVVRQHQEVVGRPAMPPYWALGFHQSRWGYKNLSEMRAVVRGYEEAGLPLEVMWSDLDHMDQARTMTLDPVSYPQDAMQAFLEELHAAGKRWVPIVECAIATVPGYRPYDTGNERGVFISQPDGRPYVGRVWPGPTSWVDYFNPEAVSWWQDMLAEYHKLVPFDGVWLDMNEPSNFITGSPHRKGLLNGTYTPRADQRSRLPRLQRQRQQQRMAWGNHSSDVDSTMNRALAGEPVQALRQGSGRARGAAQHMQPGARRQTWKRPLRQAGELRNRPGDPPYAINNTGRHTPLGERTVPVTALHHGNVSVYNAHNLYSLSQAAATYAAVQNVTGKRPFLLSRSTFLGLGRFTAHWTGDNAATWLDLRWAVAGILNTNLWGMPMAGVDICGFNGDTTEELCARWISAGAFYPFCRNHNSINSIPQELYRWPKVVAAAAKALTARYSLLPYLYSTMWLAATLGGTAAKPLFFANASADPRALEADRQWLLGESLIVSPVLEAGADSVQAYFPPGVHYSYWDDSQVNGPAVVTLAAPLGEVPLHVRGGSILPLQRSALNTSSLRLSPMSLLVALQPGLPAHGPYASHPKFKQIVELFPSGDVSKELHVALGFLYMDDGEAPQLGGPSSLNATFVASHNAAGSKGWLRGVVDAGAEASTGAGSVRIEKVRMLGVHMPGASACGSGGTARFRLRLNGKQLPLSRAEYDADRSVLSMTGLAIPIHSSFQLQWKLGDHACTVGRGTEARVR